MLLNDDVLSIRGEKTDEREEKQRNYHVKERSHGAFARSLPLHFTPDPNEVKAAFKNGVLTVTVPKSKEMQQRQHRIEVKQDTGR